VKKENKILDIKKEEVKQEKKKIKKVLKSYESETKSKKK